MKCGRCHQPNPNGKRFCGDCGAPLEPPPPTPDAVSSEKAERRQLAVFFCDLVGSTALSSRVDPEELREILSEYRQRISAEVRAAGGYIAQHLGDGIMALFGYPSATDSDAEQAVRAALACAAAARELHTTDGLPVDVRVGIATGTVVVGDVLDAWGATEQGVIGVTPNVAARLQAAAAPGTVVICDATRRLCGSWFELVDLGVLPLKGFASGQQAWKVHAESAVSSRFEAHHRGTLSLFGRSAEIDDFARAWRRTVDGTGSFMFIQGEPGIGKSRLLQALRNEVHAASTIELHCHPHQSASAFEPVVRYLRSTIGLSVGAPAEESRAKLAAAMRTDITPADMEALQALLGIGETGAGDSVQNPNQRREATFTALVNRMVVETRIAPLLLLWEDLHWADPSSLELLQLLHPLAGQERLMVVGTMRTGEVTADFLPEVERVALRGLELEQVAELAREVAGFPLAPGALEEIVSRTDGVPLFVEEITRSLLEQGVLARGENSYELAHLKAASIPATLHATLAARLDRLGSARRLAQTASVIGRRFDAYLLERIWDTEDGPTATGLGTLIGARLIRRLGAEERYLFNHALIQEAAYDSLLRVQRRRLHLRLAEAIEKSIPDLARSSPELVARHFRLGGQPLRAVEYLSQAGTLAQSRASYLESIVHLEEALTILRAEPVSPQTEALELKILFPLTTALWVTGKHGSLTLRAEYGRALDLVGHYSDPLVTFKAAQGIFRVHINRGEFEEARKASEVMWALQRATGQEEMGRHCWRSTGGIALFRGEFRAADAALRNARQPLPGPPELDDDRQPVDHLVMTYGFHAAALTAMGQLAEARALEEAAVSRGRSLQNPFASSAPLAFGGSMRALRKDTNFLSNWADELLEVTSRIGAHYLLPTALLLKSAASDKPAESLGNLANQLDDHLGKVGDAYGSLALCLVARLFVEGGNTPRALNLLERADLLQQRTGANWFASEVCRLQGLCALDEARPADARTSMLRAVKIAQAQEASYFLLMAMTTLFIAFPGEASAPENQEIFRRALDSMRQYRDDHHVDLALQVEARWTDRKAPI